MQIIEHQNIQLTNLISYTTNIKHSDILKLISHISNNLQALDLKKNDKILFTEKWHNEEDDMINAEILVPVEGSIKNCNEFKYKPLFRLINAVTIRHEGSLNTLSETEDFLKKFIKEKAYEPITPSYYVVVRNDDDQSINCIIDIYIGINYNLL